MERKIKRVIIAGKGASGKDHLRKLMESRGFKYCISHTTRPKRDNESEGEDYYFIDKSKVKLQKLERDALINRWAFGDKSFRLNTITDKDAQKWAIDNDKVNVAKQQKENIRPFEEIFLGVGADVLSFMDSVLTANPNAAVADMKNRLESTAEKVRGSGDVSKIAKLKMELSRLASIGGKDKIVPNEGIVFVYKGNTYKLTGTKEKFWTGININLFKINAGNFCFQCVNLTF